MKRLIMLGTICCLCSENGLAQIPKFRLVPAAESNIIHTNPNISTPELNIANYLQFWNGGSVGIGDLDNDGLQDVVLVGNQSGINLYKNLGKLKFKDVTPNSGAVVSGWATGVTIADYNGDGLLDIYVCRSASKNRELNKNLLFENQGNFRFIEVGERVGVADDDFSIHASFFDYDRDGDLDLFVINQPNSPDYAYYLIINTKKKVVTESGFDKLYRNDNNKFTDVSVEAGILQDNDFGLSLLTGDLNLDGWPDLYIANDFYSFSDQYYINNQKGGFIRMPDFALKHTPLSSMGSDMGDINQDGYPDIYVVDMMPESFERQATQVSSLSENVVNLYIRTKYNQRLQYLKNNLHLNDGQGNFRDVGFYGSVTNTDWSWGPIIADFNNDGLNDIFVTNGLKKDLNDADFIFQNTSNIKNDELEGLPSISSLIVKDVNLFKKMPSVKLKNYLFVNRGKLKFQNVADVAGLDFEVNSNGAAIADLDNDGDLDIVCSNIDTLAFVYENLTKNKNYLRIKLEGADKNRFSLGAQVTVWQAGYKQYGCLINARGYQSTSEPILHFGFSRDLPVDSLQIIWPDGTLEFKRNISLRQTVTFKQISTSLKYEKPKIMTLFKESNILEKPFIYNEVAFSDFKRDKLLYKNFSGNGPGIAVGDIDMDGLEDFFIPGSKGIGGTFFYQQKNGTFRQESPDLFKTEFSYTGVLLFDADNDTDLDLILTTGGVEQHHESTNYQTILYKNDGKGQFTRIGQVTGQGSAFNPPVTGSTACLAAADFDKDGDLDLFVGGRCVPGYYYQTPKSFLFVNHLGQFNDQAQDLAPGLSKVGMVNAAIWSDVNNDTWPDLWVVGEWMEPSLFINKQGRLIQTYPQGLGSLKGWWKSISAGDIDNDGDTDYILGNYGENSFFNVKDNTKLIFHQGNFDNFGNPEAILCYSLDGKVVPLHNHDVIKQQYPKLRNEYFTARSYGRTDCEELLVKLKSKPDFSGEINFMKSICLVNEGDKGFSVKPLPLGVQLAPMTGSLLIDVNDDEYLDLICTGNEFGTYYDYGRDDASNGWVLLGQGDGTFKPVDALQQGFFVPGNGCALTAINVMGKPIILAVSNGDTLRCFEFAEESTPKARNQVNYPTTFELSLPSGSSRKVETYLGCGYLSQTSSSSFIRKGKFSLKN